MSSWLSILMLAGFAVAVAQGRAVPDNPVSIKMDSYGNPLVFLRDKRAPVGYAHRAMMFTGYYRPVRRTNDAQATGVFAQGNAVSGGSYVSDVKPGDYHPEQRGPEPIDEPSISSSEAEAAPNPLDHDVDGAQREKFTPPKEQQEQEQSQPTRERDEEESDQPADSPAAEAEAPVSPVKAAKRPAKRLEGKKTKKRPSVVESDESLESDDAEDDDDDDNDDDDSSENDQAPVPFVPFKSNRRRYNNPQNLNNFFPMVFSYPRGITRSGSLEPESLPGMITAIANSYSTSKRGVASSVATAYGGAPEGRKHRRAQAAQE